MKCLLFTVVPCLARGSNPPQRPVLRSCDPMIHFRVAVFRNRRSASLYPSIRICKRSYCENNIGARTGSGLLSAYERSAVQGRLPCAGSENPCAGTTALRGGRRLHFVFDRRCFGCRRSGNSDGGKVEASGSRPWRPLHHYRPCRVLAGGVPRQEKAIDISSAGFLLKPFTPSELREKVEALTARPASAHADLFRKEGGRC